MGRVRFLPSTSSTAGSALSAPFLSYAGAGDDVSAAGAAFGAFLEGALIAGLVSAAAVAARPASDGGTSAAAVAFAALSRADFSTAFSSVRDVNPLWGAEKKRSICGPGFTVS